MRCINFDLEFERYMTAWLKEHAKEYRNFDAVEAAMPDIYAVFLDTPVNWLGGKKPGEYFTQYDSPRQLVNWMEDYYKQRVPVPDMLLNRISELCQPDSIEVTRGLSLIATVGRGMVSSRGTAARIFTALYKAGVNIRMIDQGSSELNIIVGVANADFEKATSAIYNAFVED